MIIHFKKETTNSQYDKVVERIEELHLKADILRKPGEEHSPLIGVRGDCSKLEKGIFETLEGVDNVQRVSERYKLASRTYHPFNTTITIGDENKAVMGGDNPVLIIAGPCAIESREQTIRTIEESKNNGAKMARGGAFKPRTFARTFEGLEEEGLKILKEAGEISKIPIVTEVLDTRDIDLVEKYADMFQVGTRNMQNYALLDELGKRDKPVLLKRGYSATIEEFLGAADRIIEGGNTNVALCLRGIRTFETEMRFTPDFGMIPYLKEKTHLPVGFDPSHPAGLRRFVTPLAFGAITLGADFLIIETHYDPKEAKCDASQMITPKELEEISYFARKTYEEKSF